MRRKSDLPSKPCRTCGRPFEFLKISTTREQVICPHCGGTGHVRSSPSVALQLLRAA